MVMTAKAANWPTELSEENKIIVESMNESARKNEKGDKKAYEDFVSKLLKKYKVNSIKELSGDQKKKFFDEVDVGWKADKETD